MAKRYTKEQKAAIQSYTRCLAAEERYLGSVFVTPAGQADRESQTRAAYEACVAAGVGFDL